MSKHVVAAVSDLPPGSRKLVTAKGRPIVVFNLSGIQSIDVPSAEALLNLQQYFYENNASFVFFGLDKSVEDFLEKNEILELMNITPTESEAWDIVQMEEIERELLSGEFDDDKE